MLFLINRSYSKNLSSSLFSNFGVGQSTFSSTSTKRTFLLSRKIGPTFCVRSMLKATASVQTRIAACESAQLSKTLLRTSRTMLKANEWANNSRRSYATRADFHAFEEQHGYEIKKVVAPGNKANDHYQFKNKDTGEIDQLTHAKMDKGLANNDNPIVGPGFGFKLTKGGVLSLLQRIVKNPGFYSTRELLEKELEDIKLEEWKFIPAFLKIKREDPKLFGEIQTFLTDFQKYPMKPEETLTKSSLLIYFFETFSKMEALNQEIKEITKKK